ncbi:MAG TPA: sigma-54 dependent transcriptional regulator [Dissulfurispiraceae bacterium]|nr:sigma-54 dependent transcriptional regulator [Dissulfurispiraceae bacterium]
MNKKVLVIDDDESVLWVIRKALEPSGYDIEAKSTLKAGMKAIDGYRLILLDMMLPDGSGLDALRDIRVFNPDAAVIMVTAHGRMESAIEAMREGAYDYLEKPFDLEELKIVVDKAFRDMALRDELMELRQHKEEQKVSLMVGRSKAMLKIFKEIGRVAPRDVTVLITGESGTGKELVARSIHNNSQRKFGPFVAVNVAAIPKDLLEAELFGWEKGAFTGAHEKNQGKIQAADSGTLFLDEVSELDIGLQAKLLRFLQEHEYTPLGSSKTVKANVRILGASNRDLKDCVREGLFREDLYYRFNVIEIHIPPLRERTEDIIPLAEHFLVETARALDLAPKELSKDARKALREHEWPGNVRELENAIKKASILSRGSLIERKDLLSEAYGACSIRDFLEGKLNGFLTQMKKLESSNLYETVTSEVEKALFGIVLKETGGNQLKAAKILGINRNTLAKKLKIYNIV